LITLSRAIALAAEAHSESDPDKGGAPYILHPLRVMLAQDSDEARIVALFHDVLEDVPDWGVARLRAEGFTEAMIEALLAVTKRQDEEGSEEGYMRFVARAGAYPIARKVKVADLRDNLDRSRIPAPTEKDERRWSKYKRALRYLEVLEA
jgi:(p)ppGpp synthase/HD superfamily hydrolase